MLIRSYVVKWQWELAPLTWVDYGEDETGMLEAAWSAGATSIELGTEDWPDRWVIDLGRLIQITQSTDNLRRVRRLLVTHS